MNTPKPEIGSKMVYWWAPEGAEVLAVRPYSGLYKDWYTWIVKLKSDTDLGWTEVVI